MRLLPLLALAVAIGVLTAAVGNAQDKPPILDLRKLDVQKVQHGERASRLIGEQVYNDAHQDVGKVDDVIIGQDGRSVVVLSVGKFSGSNGKLVAFPAKALTSYQGDLLLSGASQNSLKTLPAFTYAQ